MRHQSGRASLAGSSRADHGRRARAINEAMVGTLGDRALVGGVPTLRLLPGGFPDPLPGKRRR
jgi:hypothetical protein